MEERKGFGSNFGFLMAAIGSAVGLGNIWGFPNKMGANGGFTFLIIYLILAACCRLHRYDGRAGPGPQDRPGRHRRLQGPVQEVQVAGLAGRSVGVPDPGLYCALGGYCLKYVTLNVGNCSMPASAPAPWTAPACSAP